MPSWLHAWLTGLRRRSSPSAAEVANAFAYIQFKASRFLEVGADEYRLGDALGQPPAEWDPSTIEIVAHGCQQILDGRGLTPERPLEGLGIPGFYKLLQLFHFKPREQVLLGDAPPGMMLDRMEMRHVMDGRAIVLYNLVDSQPAKGPDAPVVNPRSQKSHTRAQ